MIALGVVAGKENEINRAHKNPQHKIPSWKSIQHIYETPEILRSIFSTDSCLQSNNGVSTSNTFVSSQEERERELATIDENRGEVRVGTLCLLQMMVVTRGEKRSHLLRWLVQRAGRLK